jgi:hypothetical protein
MAAEVSTIRGNDVHGFSPDDYLITILRRAVAHVQDMRIALDGVGEITVFARRGEYFPGTTDMARFCAAPAARFQVTVLDGHEAGRDTAAGVGRNIDELLWQAGFHASGGRLMQGCLRDDVVQLRHWPNLSRLPSTPNAMRISALLTRHPTSIMLAQRLLKVEAAEIYRFYSAARCAGLAHVLNRKPEEPVLKPHRNQALLGLLLGKIAGF